MLSRQPSIAERHKAQPEIVTYRLGELHELVCGKEGLRWEVLTALQPAAAFVESDEPAATQRRDCGAGDRLEEGFQAKVG
eukprot:1805914-Prymnesium_polylepis.2